MLVRMKCLTRHNGKVLHSGDSADVDASTAQRWLSKGIATIIENDEFVVDDDIDDVQSLEEDGLVAGEPEPEVEPEPEPEPELEPEDDVELLDDMSGMSAKELYEECIARGIEVEPRQSKKVYLKLLAK